MDFLAFRRKESLPARGDGIDRDAHSEADCRPLMLTTRWAIRAQTAQHPLNREAPLSIPAHHVRTRPARYSQLQRRQQDRKACMAPNRRMGPKNSATRDLMFDAAERILRTEGYSALTARRVAEEAKFNHQTVYYY